MLTIGDFYRIPMEIFIFDNPGSCLTQATGSISAMVPKHYGVVSMWQQVLYRDYVVIDAKKKIWLI